MQLSSLLSLPLAMWYQSIYQQINRSVSLLFCFCLQLGSKHVSTGHEENPPHRGFGYVEFGNASDALDAVDNMHLNQINGKTLKVNVSILSLFPLDKKAYWAL